MKLKSLTLALVASFFLTVPVQALNLINDDAETYSVEIAIGEGDASIEKYELEQGSSLQETCMEGCTITLSNGTSQAFVGDENVSIKDGEFVIAE